MSLTLAPVLRKESSSLRELSSFIHTHPETAFEEFQACAALKKFLAEHGFEVTDSPGDVQTALLGYYASEGAAENVPLLGFVGEYDALPGMGHGCGHNLVAVSAMAALLSARETLLAEKIPFRICYAGTPAEENKGGKIRMIKGGVFDRFNAILEAHPGHKTMPDVGELSVRNCTVTFHGKAAHAAICPEKGANALEAACDFICALKEWRKTLEKREYVHGILPCGGTVPNVIPDHAQVLYSLRAPDEKKLCSMMEHFTSLAEKAARQNGCTCEPAWEEDHCKAMVFNKALNEALLPIWEGLTGEKLVMTTGKESKGSSDIGNVSYLVPCAQYHFGITCGEKIFPHTPGFREAAGSDHAFEQALKIGQAMALVAERYFSEPDFRRQVYCSWQQGLAQN